MPLVKSLSLREERGISCQSDFPMFCAEIMLCAVDLHLVVLAKVQLLYLRKN